jgi:hypothetical protein
MNSSPLLHMTCMITLLLGTCSMHAMAPLLTNPIVRKYIDNPMNGFIERITANQNIYTPNQDQIKSLSSALDQLTAWVVDQRITNNDLLKMITAVNKEKFIKNLTEQLANLETQIAQKKFVKSKNKKQFNALYEKNLEDLLNKLQHYTNLIDEYKTKIQHALQTETVNPQITFAYKILNHFLTKVVYIVSIITQKVRDNFTKS